MVTTGKIPKIWRSATVIAIRKPGKPLDDPISYRPISLLCCYYKLQLCNSIRKLAGTDWGAPAPVLRASAIAIVYSVAECCVSVRGRWAHVQHVDTQFNIAMRTDPGALRPTNINCLPVLSNIFALTVPPCMFTRRLSSSRILLPSRRSYVSHPNRVSDLADLS